MVNFSTSEAEYVVAMVHGAKNVLDNKEGSVEVSATPIFFVEYIRVYSIDYTEPGENYNS